MVHGGVETGGGHTPASPRDPGAWEAHGLLTVLCVSVSQLRVPAPQVRFRNFSKVMLNSLQCESFTFDPRPRYPLVSTVKRYYVDDIYSDDLEAVTVVLAHGTGFHKESWEPTIEELNSILLSDAKRGRQKLKIREERSRRVRRGKER